MGIFIFICICVGVWIYFVNKKGKNIYKDIINAVLESVDEEIGETSHYVTFNIMTPETERRLSILPESMREKFVSILALRVFMDGICSLIAVSANKEIKTRDKTNILSIIKNDPLLTTKFYHTYQSVIRDIKWSYSNPVTSYLNTLSIEDFIKMENTLIYEVWN